MVILMSHVICNVYCNIHMLQSFSKSSNWRAETHTHTITPCLAFTVIPVIMCCNPSPNQETEITHSVLAVTWTEGLQLTSVLFPRSYLSGQEILKVPRLQTNHTVTKPSKELSHGIVCYSCVVPSFLPAKILH